MNAHAPEAKDFETNPEAAPAVAEPAFTYTSRSPAELEQLAYDIAEGKAMHSAQIPNGMLHSVFMPLFFASREHIEEWKTAKIAAFYEHLSEANPRSVNGYPTFMSVKCLDENDNRVVVARVNALLDQKAAAIAAAAQR